MNYSIEIDENQKHINETTISYEGNQINYPLKATINYKGSYDTETYNYSECRYFEYEAY